MTKRKYTRGPRLSAAPHPPRPRPKRRPRARPTPHRGRPFPREYAALQDHETHPIDKLVSAIPEVAALDRRVRGLARRRQQQATDRQAFIEYEDLRLGQHLLREELHFDAGFERGRLAGRAESLAVSRRADREGTDLARKVEVLVSATKLPPARVAALLLEVSRALVVGLGRPSPRPRTGKRRVGHA
jgi:hypothetical protein